MVLPAWRRQGIGTDLINTRFDLARALGVRRIRTGARLAGFAAMAKQVTDSQYVRLVETREVFDPSLSFLLKFDRARILGVAEEYIERDLESGGWAAILEYEM